MQTETLPRSRADTKTGRALTLPTCDRGDINSCDSLTDGLVARHARTRHGRASWSDSGTGQNCRNRRVQRDPRWGAVALSTCRLRSSAAADPWVYGLFFFLALQHG